MSNRCQVVGLTTAGRCGREAIFRVWSPSCAVILMCGECYDAFSAEAGAAYEVEDFCE